MKSKVDNEAGTGWLWIEHGGLYHYFENNHSVCGEWEYFHKALYKDKPSDGSIACGNCLKAVKDILTIYEKKS